MENYQMEVQVRWSDLDPNVHVRHSVYYDWGAYCRIQYLDSHGLTGELMQRLQIGPILFREECVFKKEIRLGDRISISLGVLRGKKDFSRWTIQHTIIKNDSTIAAIITVDGAWMDTVRRKLGTPPPEVVAVFSKMPLDEKFQWLD